jgi:hypothetical protein
MKPQKIEKDKVILTEGMDVKMFCIWACEAYHLKAQVFDFGGIRDLTTYLEAFCLSVGFNNVKSLVVVRDAETNSATAIKSIQKSFRSASLPEPAHPYEFQPGNPKTAFAILPGTTIEGNPLQYENGTLEDLCLSIALDPLHTISCVDDFLTMANHIGCKLSHPHKSKLNAYLSIQNDYVGMKIGEAAKANAWNWEHTNMNKLKYLFSEM